MLSGKATRRRFTGELDAVSRRIGNATEYKFLNDEFEVEYESGPKVGGSGLDR